MRAPGVFSGHRCGRQAGFSCSVDTDTYIQTLGHSLGDAPLRESGIPCGRQEKGCRPAGRPGVRAAVPLRQEATCPGAGRLASELRICQRFCNSGSSPPHPRLNKNTCILYHVIPCCETSFADTFGPPAPAARGHRCAERATPPGARERACASLLTHTCVHTPCLWIHFPPIFLHKQTRNPKT